MNTNLLTLTPQQFCDVTDACQEGRDFAIQFSTMKEVWDKCPNLNWLLWILERTKSPRDSQLRLFSVWCARNTPLQGGRVTGSLLTDKRSIDAMDVAERFAHGKATEEELAAARAAAWAARAAARAAAWAARAAARAAARDARDAARAAARAAAWAARAAARAAARDAQLAQFKLMVDSPF
jgi:hypothetical protein